MRSLSKKFFFIVLLAIVFAGLTRTGIVRKHLSKQHSPLASDVNLDSYNYQDQQGEWWGTKTLSHPILTQSPDNNNVLSAFDSGNKRIEVDLTNQRLYAYEGDVKIYDFVMSSGLYDWTPRGEFTIWIKLKSTNMKGGNKALGTYYYLPNVPYTMFFANADIPPIRGFGIHGTYWHNDFGRPKSHGCINLLTEDAEKLYYWATPQLNGKTSISSSKNNPGTRIIIYGKYEG